MPAPANDNFASAQVIAGASGSHGPVTIDDATIEGGEQFGALIGPNPGNQTIWYKWTAPADGVLALGVSDGFNEPIIIVWTGAALGSLTEIGAADDPFHDPTELSVEVESGTDYYIQIGTWGGYTGVAWTLTWDLATPPANDDMANVEELVGVTGTVSGTNVAATEDSPYDPLTVPTISNHAWGATVWYKIAAPDWWEIGNVLTLTVDVPPGVFPGIVLTCHIFEATAWPPTSDGDWNDLSDAAIDDGVNEAVSYTGPAPAGGVFYIGIGVHHDRDVASETPFTLSWAFAVGTAPQGVCIAFDDDVFEPEPVWTRIDDPVGLGIRVQEWSVSRGRAGERDQTQTGTASITIVDFVGILDPTNADGAFYGKLDPMKQAAIALRNPVTETWSTVFRGFVSEWLYEWDESGAFARITLELVDAFAVFSAVELTPAQHGDAIPERFDQDQIYYAGEPSTFKHVDQRIIQGLDDAGWAGSGSGIDTANLRNIFSGNVSVQEKVYERRDQLLALLFDAADAEFPGIANIYMSRNGVVTFHGRYARFFPDRPAYAIATWEVGGKAQADADASVVPFQKMSGRRSDSDIFNVCIALPLGVNAEDVPDQATIDMTSVAKYGWRELSFPDLLTFAGHDDDLNPTTAVEETKKFSDYYVGNYKDPKTRVTNLTFVPKGPDHFSAEALWAFMCAVEIGDVIELLTTHPGGGGFDEPFYVEGIRYSVIPARTDMDNVTLQIDVSPASYFAYNPFGELDEQS